MNQKHTEMKKHAIFFLVMIACLFTGCIKEDQSDCRRSFTLLFRYNGDGTTDIFPDKVTKVNLYVYDTADRALIRSYELDQADLQSLQGIRLDDLEPGTYEAVCWGNAYESSSVLAAEQRETGVMAAPEYHAGNPVDTNDELYHVAKTFTITNAWTDQQDICYFNCAHIDVTVRLEGFEDFVFADTRADGNCPVGMRLENLPGYCDFSGTPFDEQTLYLPGLTAVADDDATAYESRFHTLRFGDDGEVALRLTRPDTDAPFYTLPIRQFLDAHDLSVEDRQEVALNIVLRLDADGVSISVAPFEEEDIHPGLDERNN